MSPDLSSAWFVRRPVEVSDVDGNYVNQPRNDLKESASVNRCVIQSVDSVFCV